MLNPPFGFEKPQDSPGFLLWQTSTLWTRLIKKTLEPHNLSHAQFVILALLLWFDQNNYDTTQVLISNWSKLDKMTVSKSLKILANRKLITRTEHTTDTRAKTVQLTQSGKTLVHALIPIIEKIDAEFFNPLQPHDQKTLIQILNQLPPPPSNIL
ncbi:MAG: MarR family transcriptional regulator [Verrucomicrobia bacterium]|nr:MAG: MarR family transcriptional regulator [Verrucomicrobiota bacterium]